MATATVTTKGQVTIPIEVRKRLGIRPGTRVEFIERADGGYELFAATRSIADLRGMIARSGPPVTIEEMDEAVAEAIAERYRRL